MARITADFDSYQAELAAARRTLQGGRIAENTYTDYVNRREIQKNNGARPAYAELGYVSRGTGQQRVSTPLTFPVIFRQMPHFTSGSAVIKNPNPTIWHDPVANCGIWRWQRDDRGYYTGVYIWVRVDMYPINSATIQPPPADVETGHFLTFSGSARKSIPQMEQLVTALKARQPGIQ